MRYHVADANSYLVVTGGGIDSIKIVKKAWIMPWQRMSLISISPFDFEISLQAMTIEKLQFCLPAVFTIGPDDSPDSLMKYAKILTGRADAQTKNRAVMTGRNHVQDIVKGIIEGETRVIVSQMTMEEIFKERQVFKTHVIENVQSELDQFGLRIYNANVKELQDAPGSEYFTFLSRKAHEGASNQAKIDVANARMHGEIGEKEKQGRTKQEVSKIDAETAVLETKRKSEKAQADAELTNTQTKLNMSINLNNIQANREAEAKDAELQKIVEMKRAEMKLEKLRATDLVAATIKKESAQQDAEAKLYSETKAADATRYKIKQDAEGRLFSDAKTAEGSLIKKQQEAEGYYYRAAKEAEAKLYTEIKTAEATVKHADAAFYAKKRQAEGLTEMAKAYGDLAHVFGGPQGLLQFLMLDRNGYEQLALANAKAVQGLAPKITVWNTGDQSGSGSSAGDGAAGGGFGAIRNIMQSLPPLLSTIGDQTGIQPPNWLAQMPPQQQQQQQELVKAAQAGKVNGVPAK